jgi:hypothetical protein
VRVVAVPESEAGGHSIGSNQFPYRRIIMEKFVTVTKSSPQDIAAVQFKGKPDNATDGTFAGFPTREDPSRNPTEIAVLVPTVHGGTPAFPGDWIVSDADGKLSVVSDSHFGTHYKSSAPSKPFVPAPQLTSEQLAARQAGASPVPPLVPAVPTLTPQQLAAQQAAGVVSAPALTPQQIAAQHAVPPVPQVPSVPPAPQLTPQQLAAQKAEAAKNVMK